MITPDFRSLCAELADRLQHAITSVNADSYYEENRDAVDRARAAVAEACISEMSAHMRREAARYAELDRLEKAIDFDSHGWQLTPEGEQWIKLMDEIQS